jgi:hypothetical protein
MVYLDKQAFDIREMLESAESELKNPKLEQIERNLLAKRMRRLAQSIIDLNFNEDKIL